MNIYEKTKARGNSIAGKMMVLEGMIVLVPLLVIPFYPGEAGVSGIFLIPACLSILAGMFVCRYGKQISNSSRFVVFSWFYGILLAAIPFFLYGGVTPAQALFESVSGFTTTGLSVLNVEKLPHIFLFYRAFLQYVGGLGFIMTMLLFVQEKDSAVLYQEEGHPDRLMPGIGKTAKVIGTMYGFFLFIGTILYTIFGMPFFDSVVHTMCALSTGGFSNKMDSIGYYHSLPIECITVILMLIGTTNFSFLLLLFKGKIRDFCKASEIRFLVGLILITVPVLTVFLAAGGKTIGEGLRLSLFNAFSALSTTGYATCSYVEWPECALAVMILLMVIGGGLGSTAGGIKLARVCILLKNLVKNIRKKMLPDRTILLTYYHRGTEKELLENEQIEEASTYAGCYLCIYLLGTMLLTFFSGCTLVQGAFEFASSLGTVGLSIGVTNPDTSTICLFIEMIGMILGRLEIFVTEKYSTRLYCLSFHAKLK
ncbi:MAG: potassium transporter TrkG [Lachnospiraceae bacterium]|nr:potassium transporter TrkG [Lachnospiraceae bacterium]